MPNRLLKELQAEFKTAKRASKPPEERREKIQPGVIETVEDSSKTIGMHPIHELANLPKVSILTRKLQKQFEEARRDSKDEKENQEKAFEPITRELVQIKEAVRHPSPVSLPLPLPLPLSSPMDLPFRSKKLILQQAQMELVR